MLNAGNTFNEEVILLPIDESQYTVRVKSDEAEVYMINELEFNKKVK